jgi:hypothetical protein
MLHSESNPIVSYCNSLPTLNHCVFLLASFRMVELALPPPDALAPFTPYVRVTGQDSSLQHLLDALNAAVRRGWYDRRYFVPDQWAADSFQCIVPHRLYLASPQIEPILADLAVESFLAPSGISGLPTGTKPLDLGDGPELKPEDITAFLDIIHLSKSSAIIRSPGNPDWKLQMLLVSSLVLEHGLTISEALGWLELCQYCALKKEHIQALKTWLPKLQTDNRWALPVQTVVPRMPEVFGFSRAAQKHKRAREQLDDLMGAAARLGEGRPRPAAAENPTIHAKNGPRVAIPRRSLSDLGVLE